MKLLAILGSGLLLASLACAADVDVFTAKDLQGIARSHRRFFSYLRCREPFGAICGASLVRRAERDVLVRWAGPQGGEARRRSDGRLHLRRAGAAGGGIYGPAVDLGSLSDAVLSGA